MIRPLLFYPKSLMKPIELGLLNTVSYLLLTWDYRAVAQANYLQAIIANLLIAAMSFSIFKRIAEAKTRAERFAYIVSGGVAVTAGIYVSKVLLGQ